MDKVEIVRCRLAGVQLGGWGERPAGARLPVLGVALLGAWAGVAGAALQPQAGTGTVPHAFNFAYQAQGARGAAPTQVFDDGQRTYMQFNALDRVPELWTDEGNGAHVGHRLGFHLESPYVVIDQVLPRMRLVIDGGATVLVNQAWKVAKAPPPKPAPRPVAPRTWTDTTPFGPEELPGPVAATHSAASPADAGHQAGSAPGGQSALAVSEEDDAVGDASTLRHNQAPVRDVDDANRRLAGKLLLPNQAIGDSELEAMRAQALAMIARAHQAGDGALERRLRGIFREVALAGLDAPAKPAQTKRDARWRYGPVLALADTRPRTDVPLSEEEEDPAATRTPAQPPAPAGGAAQGPRPAAGSASGTAGATGNQALPAPGGSAATAAPGGSAATAAPGDPLVPRADGLVFEVRDNQRLSQALGRFLETLGWRLEWESQSDFVVRRGYVVKAPTLRQVLMQTLGEYRLSAVLYSGNLVVAVTGGEH